MRTGSSSVIEERIGLSVWQECRRDWENGTIYDLTQTTMDTLGGINYPITFIRTFPQIQEGSGLTASQFSVKGSVSRFADS